MKKLMNALLCTAAALTLANTAVFAAPVSAVIRTESAAHSAEAGEAVTDPEQIRSMLTTYVEENGLDARIVSDREYPGYQPVVVEYNRDTAVNAWTLIVNYMTEQNIDRSHVNVVPIVNGMPITTVNPDAQGTTTTVTTAAEPETISDPDTVRAMFSKLIEENHLSAKAVDNAAYPGYLQPVIIEFTREEGQPNPAVQIIRDFAEAYHIDKYAYTFVAIVDGKPITTVNPNTGTTTAAAVVPDAGDANCDHSCDVADAVLIVRFAAEDKNADITDQGKKNADVTHDGNVDDQDAVKILQYIAKKIELEDLAK